MKYPTYRTISIIGIFVVAAASPISAAEWDGRQPHYIHEGAKVVLEIVDDEVIVGLHSGEGLFDFTTFMYEGDTIKTVTSRLGTDIWRVRLDPQDPPPNVVTLARQLPFEKASEVNRKQAKTSSREARLERQGQLIRELLENPAVAWSYPGYRNSETGTLLWPTSRIIVSVAPKLVPDELERRLPAEVRLVRALAQPGLHLIELIDPKADDPLEVSARLAQNNPWISWAEPDFIQNWRHESIPNDPLFPNQWHLRNTGQGGGVSGADARLPGAWDSQTGDGSVVIAIIDDGVQLTHPDIPIFVNTGEIPSNGVDDDGNGYVDDVNGWDFKFGDNDPNPALTGPGSHGTAVAGVAGASGNNAVGVTGACQNCRILPVRIFDGNGVSAPNSALAEAIIYAGTFGDVLNNSWGGGSPSPAVTSAIQGANSGGRGGLGSPVLFANANSASGYYGYSLTGFPAGTWTFTWTYHKDSSVDAGFDTVWLDDVTFPDGATQDFETCTSLPGGWSSSGDASWTAVSNGTRASSKRGGHCSIGAGAIEHNEFSSVSVTRTLAIGGDLEFRAWVSSQPAGPLSASCNDFFDLTVFDGTSTYGPFFPRCGTWSNQGRPLQDGSISYPSSLTEAISVGAATNFDRRSDYAQWGPGNDFVCQSNGGSLGITTTDVTGANGYSSTDYTSGFGGTSSATPLCAGIAALAISEDPTLTSSQVRQLMRASGRKIGSYAYVSGWNEQYGYGAVDASAVVAGATPGGSIVVEKQTIPDGDPATFTFTGDAAGTIGDGGQLISATGAGAFTATELVPGGWSLFEIECDDGDSVGSVGTATAAFNVASGETVTCVFTNCSDSQATVDLSGVTVIEAETYTACDTLTADTFRVGGAGSARFRAGSRIVLENGFSVASGGRFRAEIVGMP